MRLLIGLLFILIPFIVKCQIKDTIQLKKDLIGNWELLYSIDIDSTGKIKDTIRTNSLGAKISLKITEKMVDEVWDFSSSKDSIVNFGEGQWMLRYKNKNEVWIDFDCKGMFLCGYYKIVDYKYNKLILKSCSIYEYEGCQLEYLRRR